MNHYYLLFIIECFKQLIHSIQNRNWKKQLAKPTRPSLITAIVKTFWREYALLSFICTFNDVVARLGQPLLLGQLLLYFRLVKSYSD